MPNVTANGIQIEYDTFGDPASPPLLLIMGFSCQMICWDEQVCNQLAEMGHYVIRFDNRDVGLSSKCEDNGGPKLLDTICAVMEGKKVQVPYTLEDMAEDAAGLLRELGIEKAHICGISMGGMIAQCLAIRHPELVSSLISIYSTTGNPALPPPKPKVLEFLFAPLPKDRDAYIAHNVNLYREVSGKGFPFDEPYHREVMGRSYDRAFYPKGLVRQFLAIMTQDNRKEALKSLTVPALVIHGTDDPFVPVECGKDTAEALPNAELLIIDGMGHDSPHGEPWLQIIEAIANHTKKSGHGAMGQTVSAQ